MTILEQIKIVDEDQLLRMFASLQSRIDEETNNRTVKALERALESIVVELGARLGAVELEDFLGL